MRQVCLKTANWIFVLMLIAPGSVLFAEDPASARDRAIVANPPVAATPVQPALHHALANSLAEAASFGAKTIPTPPTGSWGVVSEGDGGGGIFRDSDSEAEAWLGSEGYGVHGFGVEGGAFFQDTDNTGHAYVGYLGWGIGGYGISAGGYFEDSNGTGRAWVAKENFGIEAHGSVAGGFFNDSDGTAHAYVANGDWGIEAHGNVAGGQFRDINGTGYAYVGHADWGIEAGGTGAGGYFEDSDGSGFAHIGWGHTGVFGRGNVTGGVFDDGDDSGYARVGYGDRGVDAGGNDMGGHFVDSDGTAHANLGYGGFGIEAHGNEAGGYFEDNDGWAHAYVGYDWWGIEAVGTHAGGYFRDLEDEGFAYVGRGNTGIIASGTGAGGEFENLFENAYAYLAWMEIGVTGTGDVAGGSFRDLDDSTDAKIANSSYSIKGNGTKAFVQNHPYDRDSVIVYVAPEGDEVATYTRGTAKIVGGEATVPLGETFKWVTNPDIGLTAHLTPRGEPIPLAVVDLSTEEMIVRAPGDAPDDLVFDYIVYGLRIGFEETSVVQEKTEEAYIPSMSSHRELFLRRPDLESYNSLERFKGMRRVTNPKAELDLRRAQALRDAIIEFDPAVHQLPRPTDSREMIRENSTSEIEGPRGGTPGRERFRETRADHDRRLAPGRSTLSTGLPVDDEGNVYASSFRPSSEDLASLVDVSEVVEPGDVLVIDRGFAGRMRRGFEGHDSGVIGVVSENAGLVLGSQPPPSRISETIEGDTESASQQQAAVALAGVVTCKVDAGFGAIWPGDLLVTSPTPGHAMRTDSPLPGTMVGKALEQLEEGTGLIRVLVMLR